jgi:hypothetical protein
LRNFKQDVQTLTLYKSLFSKYNDAAIICLLSANRQRSQINYTYWII